MSEPLVLALVAAEVPEDALAALRSFAQDAARLAGRRPLRRPAV